MNAIDSNFQEEVKSTPKYYKKFQYSALPVA